MIFESERLYFRQFKLTDCDDLVRICNDLRVTQFLPLSFPYRRSDAENWIKGMGKDDNTFDFAIILKETDTLIGSISFSKLTENQESAEIGYWLDPNFWRKGLMPEALKRVIKFAFEEKKIHKIFAKHCIENPASGKVMQKAGMTRVGILKEEDFKNGVYHDTILYEIINH